MGLYRYPDPRVGDFVLIFKDSSGDLLYLHLYIIFTIYGMAEKKYSRYTLLWKLFLPKDDCFISVIKICIVACVVMENLNSVLFHIVYLSFRCGVVMVLVV